MAVQPKQCDNIKILLLLTKCIIILTFNSPSLTLLVDSCCALYQDNASFIFNTVNIVTMFSKSLDSENKNNPNTNVSMTQTSPKKKAKCLCYFNNRWKQNWARPVNDHNRAY